MSRKTHRRQRHVPPAPPARRADPAPAAKPLDPRATSMALDELASLVEQMNVRAFELGADPGSGHEIAASLRGLAGSVARIHGLSDAYSEGYAAPVVPTIARGAPTGQPVSSDPVQVRELELTLDQRREADRIDQLGQQDRLGQDRLVAQQKDDATWAARRQAETLRTQQIQDRIRQDQANAQRLYNAQLQQRLLDERNRNR